MGSLDLNADATYTLIAVAGMALLGMILIASFVSRSRVFCQYLRHMTGIELKPTTVRRVFRTNGRGGVRDLLLDLLIQEDLADDSRRVTPDSKPDTSVFEIGKIAQK
jgi:glycosylphosphatidylinositol transamidase (GPIT) subunit GPI8